MNSVGDLAHLPMLVVPALFAAVALGRESRARGARAGRGWLFALAGGSAVAAIVHALVCPEHFAESALYGTFFLATAIAGLGYAALVLLRPSRWLLSAGVAANIAIVALWLVTRLVAVPVGPGAGETEPFGMLDIIASSAELVCALAAARLLALAMRPRPEARASAVGALEAVAG